MDQEELKMQKEYNSPEYEIPYNPDYIQENIVYLNTESLSRLNYDENKFSEGLKSMSYLCGKITALVNVGITPSEALVYISNMDTLDKATANEKEIAELQSNTSIECAKYESVNSQKNIF